MYCKKKIIYIGPYDPPPQVNTRQNTLFHIVPDKRNFVTHNLINIIIRYINEHLFDFDFFFDNSYKLKTLLFIH
jgi:hypothetical protein